MHVRCWWYRLIIKHAFQSQSLAIVVFVVFLVVVDAVVVQSGTKDQNEDVAVDGIKRKGRESATWSINIVLNENLFAHASRVSLRCCFDIDRSSTDAVKAVIFNKNALEKEKICLFDDVYTRLIYVPNWSERIWPEIRLTRQNPNFTPRTVSVILRRTSWMSKTPSACGKKRPC